MQFLHAGRHAIESSQKSNACCVCRYTTCVPKYTTVPLGIQDVFAGKLNVAVSVGTELKRLCLRIQQCEIQHVFVNAKLTATLKFTAT